jgi:hypothetical protein
MLTVARLAHCKFLAVTRAAGEPGVDAPFEGRRHPRHYGVVFFPGLSFAELARQKFVGRGSARDDDDTGGVLIQTVYDACAWGVYDLCVWGKRCVGGFIRTGVGVSLEPEHTVRQGPTPIAGPRMGHQALGFIDNKDIVVTIEDRKKIPVQAQSLLKGLRSIRGEGAPLL